MARISHFEIPANNPQSLMDFYGKALGWQFQQYGDDGYWFAITGEGEEGINGAIMQRRDPQQPIVNTATVTDIDAATAAVLDAGGNIAMPKFEVGDMGWVTYCIDPEGNLFGLWQSK